jgi:hypothetical protein
MAKSGYLLIDCLFPYCYTFDKTDPQNMTYRLEFKPDTKDLDAYLAMVSNYGLALLAGPNNWYYFYKRQSENALENEIFSDNPTRADMIVKTVKSRFLPLITIELILFIFIFLSALPTGLLPIIMMYVILFVFFTYLTIHLIKGYFRLQKSIINKKDCLKAVFSFSIKAKRHT